MHRKSNDIYCQEFEYDVNGRKIRQVQKEKESDADTASYYITTFAYDSRDMLTEEKYQRWDSGNSAWDNMYWARYAYDTAGNMVIRQVNQIVNGNAKQYADGPFTYSRGYQLTGFTRKGNFGAETRTFTLTYDANGNMTHISQSATFTDTFYNITEMEFQFDEKNRMTHYRFGGSGSYHQIKYDALGRVRERVDLTPTTSKYYSDGRQLIQQLDSSDNVEFDYFRGPTDLMRQIDVDASNKKRFYIKDPLGTILALVNPSDLSVTHYNYNAWGEHLDKDGTDFPTDTNSMRYIGCRVEAFGASTAQTDAVYHFDQRHYVPTIGFLQRDTYHSDNTNKVNYVYRYAMNNPVFMSDPLGLFPQLSPGSSPEDSSDDVAPGFDEYIKRPSEFHYSGTGNCCTLDKAIATGDGYADIGSLDPAARLPFIMGLMYTHDPWARSWYAALDDPDVPGTSINCWFKTRRLFFYWRCYWSWFLNPCPENREDPCYELSSDRTDISTWLGSTNSVGFIWRNKIQKLITKTFIRFEVITPYGHTWDEKCIRAVNSIPGFEDGGKNFCINDLCKCGYGSSVSLDGVIEFMERYRDICPKHPTGPGLRTSSVTVVHSIEAPMSASKGLLSF